MTERSPIFSAKHSGRQIGYIQGAEAFDLLSNPRATYDRKTGLLRDPKTLSTIGYLSLQGTFVGCSWMADKLFPASEEAVRPRERGPSDLKQRNVVKPVDSTALTEKSKKKGRDDSGKFESPNAFLPREHASVPLPVDLTIPFKAALEVLSSNSQPKGERALVAGLSVEGDGARDEPSSSTIEPLASQPGTRAQAGPLTPLETHENTAGESAAPSTIGTFVQRMAEDAHSAIRAAESGGKTREQASAVLLGDLAIPFKVALEAFSSNGARSPREHNAKGERALVAGLSAEGDAARDEPSSSTIEPLASEPGTQAQAGPLTPLETRENTAVKSGESAAPSTEDAHSAIRATESGGKTREQASAVLPGDLAIPFKAALEAFSSNSQSLTRLDHAKSFDSSSRSSREPDGARSPREHNAEGERALVAGLSAESNAARDQSSSGTLDPLASQPSTWEQGGPPTSLGTQESTAVKSWESGVPSAVGTFVQRMAKDAHSAGRDTESGSKTREQASVVPRDRTIPIKATLEALQSHSQPSTRFDQAKSFEPSFSQSYLERDSVSTDAAASASDDSLSLLLFQPRNKNRRTPGEDAVLVNEVTNAALPEQKVASQLANNPSTADKSGASERRVERPPFEPDKGPSFLDALEQQGARDLVSSPLKLELERAIAARAEELEGRQLPIVGGEQPDLSNKALAVDVEVAHLIAEHVHSAEPVAETDGKMTAGLRLFSDPGNHNNSAQKKLQKQSDADSPDNVAAGVSSWPQEESLSTDNAGSAAEDSLSLLLFQRHNEKEGTPGEDAFVVNEVTNAALLEPKIVSQLASELSTADESGASEQYVKRPPLEPDKGQSVVEQQSSRDLASSRLELELERALAARRQEFEGRQLPTLEQAKPDLSNRSFTVDVKVAHPPILRTVQDSSQRNEVEDLLKVVLRQLEKKSR